MPLKLYICERPQDTPDGINFRPLIHEPWTKTIAT